MYTLQGAKKKLGESGYKEVEGQLDLLSAISPAPEPTLQVKKVSEPIIKKTEEIKEKIEVEVERDIPVKTKAFLQELKSELNEIKNLLQ